MSDLFTPHELGFGVEGVIEAAVHAVRRQLQSDYAIIKLDFKNSFNSMRRDRMSDSLCLCGASIGQLVIRYRKGGGVFHWGLASLEPSGLSKDDGKRLPSFRGSHWCGTQRSLIHWLFLIDLLQCVALWLQWPNPLRHLNTLFFLPLIYFLRWPWVLQSVALVGCRIRRYSGEDNAFSYLVQCCGPEGQCCSCNGHNSAPNVFLL